MQHTAFDDRRVSPRCVGFNLAASFRYNVYVFTLQLLCFSTVKRLPDSTNVPRLTDHGSDSGSSRLKKASVCQRYGLT